MAGQCLLRELRGPLNPCKDDEEEEDCAQEDEEDQDSEFVDAEELCSGGIKAGSLPGRLRGERARLGRVYRVLSIFTAPRPRHSRLSGRPVAWLLHRT